MGIWTISGPCNWPGPSGSAQAQSHIESHTEYFHFMMKSCCACPDLWPVGTAYTQLMMRSSAGKVTWWPLTSVQSLLRPNSRPRVVLEEKSIYLWRVAGLCSKTLKAWSMILLWGPTEVSSVPVCSWLSSTGPPRSYGPRKKSLKSSLNSLQSLLLLWNSLKWSAF